ncbi:MAG: alkylation response protein AidB-like acyl-CoA dehydrogenase [Candidatus Azotimanducaceae bacterium]|jgi:alkylation response protein AidB-like acyl-CoA dehydrogenase
MQTEFTEDQAQFREIVARFLHDKSQPFEVRRLMASKLGYDVDVWHQLCNEVGLAGTHIPEAFGGFGFGPIELGIIAEEMGKHLYCGPFFSSSVMAASALLNCANDIHKTEVLPSIALGTTLATLVLDSLNTPNQIGIQLNVNEGLLTGTAGLVLDAHIADLMIVIAESQTGLGMYSLPTQTNGITIDALETLDTTRKMSRVSFDNVAVVRMGNVSQASLNKIWDYICVALAHEMIGGAQHLLETTIEYTKFRYQFGRPIGSFQGLKHRCADLLMEVEIAKAATHHAARCLDSGEGEPYAASMAKALAADTYMKAAKEAIQLRGGIGFTWEEDTQLWYKRAKSSEVFMGTPSFHRERMISIMELDSQEAQS